MNRNLYYIYIENKLHVLSRTIESRGKLNLLDLHVHSENFYLHFFNLLFDYELENLNIKLQNVDAIDLIDHKHKLIFQVSSTSTKQKIESALSKNIIEAYSGYIFKFISISKEATELRTKTYNNPYSISFNPLADIYDITSLLNIILAKTVPLQKEIFMFIKDELGNEVDIVKLDSNLAKVINLLATEEWDDANKIESVNTFEIERKITYNDLNLAKETIKEYSLFYEKVDSKYTEFDSLGSNKSNSVLATIKREYINVKNKSNGDDVFFTVIEKIKERILISSNYTEIAIDELELCVDILVVDAFIRCKIFSNPNNYDYATS